MPDKRSFVSLVLCILLIISFYQISVASASDVQIYYEDFQSYPPNSDPPGWTEVNGDFRVMDLEGNNVLGADDLPASAFSFPPIHLLTDLQGFELTGKMRLDGEGEVGVIFNSQEALSQGYYSLASNGGSSFWLGSLRGDFKGITDSKVKPQRGEWYRFRLQAVSGEDKVAVKARIWPETRPEPMDWQIKAYDDGDNPHRKGTIGVQAAGTGQKYWDDLTLSPIESAVDKAPPFYYGLQPDSKELSRAPDEISVHVADLESGVDIFSIKVEIDKKTVSPFMKGSPTDYLVNVPITEEFKGKKSEIVFYTCDLAEPPNCASKQKSYKISTEERGFRLPGWIYSVLGLGLLATGTILSIIYLFGYKALIRWYGAKEIKSEPNIIRFIRKASKKAGIKPPMIYKVDSEDPFILSCGRSKKTSAIIITQGILDELAPEELQALLAYHLFMIRQGISMRTFLSFFSGLLGAAPTIAFISSLLLGFGQEEDPAPQMIKELAKAIFWPHTAFLVLMATSKKKIKRANAYTAKITGSATPLKQALLKIGSKASEVNPGHLPLMTAKLPEKDMFHDYFNKGLKGKKKPFLISYGVHLGLLFVIIGAITFIRKDFDPLITLIVASAYLSAITLYLGLLWAALRLKSDNNKKKERMVTQRKAILSWFIVVLYTSLVFYLSSLSNIPYLDSIGQLDPRRFSLHILEYTGLSYLLYRAFHTTGLGKKTSLLLTIIIGVGIAYMDELFQISTPGRKFNILDLYADSAGILIGVALSYLRRLNGRGRSRGGRRRK